jgi:hypothetical protein
VVAMAIGPQAVVTARYSKEIERTMQGTLQECERTLWENTVREHCENVATEQFEKTTVKENNSAREQQCKRTCENARGFCDSMYQAITIRASNRMPNTYNI